MLHVSSPARSARLRTDLDENETRAAEVALAHRTPTPEELAWRREIDSALSDAPATSRNAYTMYIPLLSRGLHVREAAATLGLTMPAAKTRLFRAQHQMRSALRARLVNGNDRARHSTAITNTRIAA